MLWCPRCLTEHLDTAIACRDCGITLVDAATAAGLRSERESRHRWGESTVVVEWLSSAADAGHLQMMLRQQGIEATVVEGRPHVLGPLVDPTPATYGVVVFGGDADRARQVWSEWQSAAPLSE